MRLLRNACPGILLASLGPLFLAAASPGELWWGDLALLLAITSVLAVVLSGLRQWSFPYLDRDRGTAFDLIALAVLTLPFLVLRDIAILLPAATHPRIRTTLGVTLGLALIAGWYTARRRQPPSRAIAVTQITIMVLVVSSFARLGWSQYLASRAWNESPLVQAARGWNADSAVATLRIDTRPDVYLLILDAYAGDSILRTDYGMNRTPFRAALDTLGFSPIQPYTSNYAQTYLSVSSILNFSHVAQIDDEPTGQTRNSSLFNGLIHDNRTVRLFQAAGYDIHWIPAPLFATRALPPDIAQVHRGASAALNESWMYSDLITTWLDRIWTPGVLWNVAGQAYDLSSVVDSALRILPRLARDGRPSFAVVHLMATHFPYMNTPDCRVDPAAAARLERRVAYASAVGCLDAALLPLFRDLIGQGGDSLVILAVGDHAPRPLHFNEAGLRADQIPPEIQRSHFDATGFFYFPPRMRASFTPPRSGVNLMPAALQALFGAGIPLSPDTRYFSPSLPTRLYGFTSLGARPAELELER